MKKYLKSTLDFQNKNRNFKPFFSTIFMEKTYSLEYGQKIIASKKGTKIIFEFVRCSDKVMDNMMDVYRYERGKSKKGTSSWILLKDLNNYLKNLSSIGYDEIEFFDGE